MLWPWGVLAVLLLAFAIMIVIGSEVQRWRDDDEAIPDLNEAVHLAPSDLKPLDQISLSVRTSPERAPH